MTGRSIAPAHPAYVEEVPDEEPVPVDLAFTTGPLWRAVCKHCAQRGPVRRYHSSAFVDSLNHRAGMDLE